jgi:hypothetical protein
MIIGGTIQRSIYPQQSLNWAINLVPQNNTGYFDFIFSGDGGNETIFSLKNGQILSYDNQLIGGYFSSENLNFSGNFGANTIDLYQDSSPLFLGKSRETFGDIYGIALRSSNDSGVDFKNLTIIGSAPQVNGPINPFLILYPNENIPFDIYNSGLYDFTILSGTTSNPNFTISGERGLVVPSYGDSVFYLVYGGSTVIPSYQNVFITLYTDHGVQKFNTTISGSPAVNKTYSLYLNASDGYVLSARSKTFNLTVRNSDGAKIGIGYKYVSGATGDYYSDVINYQNVYNVPVSGYITGSGYLYGQITGDISVFNTGSSEYETSSGSGFFSRFYVAKDGPITGKYSVTGYGIGSTILLSDVTGYALAQDVPYSGVIGIRGGYVTGNITQYVSGTGVLAGKDVSGILNYPQSIQFIPFTGKLTGDFNSNEYTQVSLVSPTVFVTGNFSKKFWMTGYAFATGEMKSGVLGGDFGYVYDPGIYTFYTYYSGDAPVVGSSYNNFNPVRSVITPNGVSGKLITNVVTVVDQQDSCTVDFSSISVVPTGYISGNLYTSDGKTGVIEFKQGIKFNLLPIDSGEFIFENSDTGILNTGYPYLLPRTDISRHGKTASGTGFFNNVFQKPFFNPLGERGDVFSGYKTGEFIGWKESLEPIITDLEYTGAEPIIDYISGNFDLPEFLISDHRKLTPDYAEISFSITGTGGYFPLNFTLESKQQRELLFVDMYRGPFVSGITGINSSGETGIISYTGINKDTLVYKTSGNYFYLDNCSSMCGQKQLGFSYAYQTGDYKIFISGKTIKPSIKDWFVSFSSDSFTGYKQNGRLNFNIIRSGYLNFPLSGKVTAAINSSYRPYGISTDKVYSGLSWGVVFPANQSSLTLGFDIYPDAALQRKWGGNLAFELYPIGCFCGDLFSLPGKRIETNAILSSNFYIIDTTGIG